jgi:hypothetical protein
LLFTSLVDYPWTNVHVSDQVIAAVHVVHGVLIRDLDWPSAQHVYTELKLLGVRDPPHCLSAAPRDRIFVEKPGDLTSPVVLRVRELVDLDARAGALDGALSGFVPVLRRCVDHYIVAARQPRAYASPVIVSATGEFLAPYSEDLTPDAIMIAGLLLQGEGLATITRLREDADALWGAELHDRLLEFSAVGTMNDYLAILNELEARSEQLT